MPRMFQSKARAATFCLRRRQLREELRALCPPVWQLRGSPRTGRLLDSFLAVHGHQDIHRLRGVQYLTEFDKIIFAKLVEEHLNQEFPQAPGAFASNDAATSVE